METVLNQLGRFVSELSFDRLPEEVVKETKYRIADQAAEMLAGSVIAEAEKIRRFTAAKAPGGNASIIGLSKKVAPAYAAMANATIAHYVDTDDVHRTSHLHPGICTVPAAFAVGQALGASGKDVITAIVAGYEVCIRLGEAVSPSVFVDRVYLPCGILGTQGSAATAAWLMGLSKETCMGAISSTTYLAAISPFHNYSSGSTIKNFVIGWNNLNGILSAELAEQGFYGDEDAAEADLGYFNALAVHYDVKQATAGLGEKYMILDTGLKPYACCRQLHSSIDCILKLRQDYELDYREIKAIHIRTFNIAARANAKRWPSIEAAQYSIPYVAAAALLDGDLWRGQFSVERLKDEAILSIVDKITVTADPELNAMYDKFWPSVVEITLKNGEMVSAQFDVMKGEPEYPMDEEDIHRKFLSLATEAVSFEKAGEIWERIMKFEELESIDEFIAFINEQFMAINL